MMDYLGVINIYKEKGFTSHDVVNIVRKSLGKVKTGHTGTLDPNAEGVLPICVGKATKLSEYLASEVKAYRTTLILGANTDTEDATGTVKETFPVDFDTEKIATAVQSFVGEYDQTPPMYSARKINGKKLYELAREGKEVERKSKRITIHQIDIRAFLPPNQVEIEVICSKGTYIRTLCYDIGKKLDMGGHMGDLLRTRSGHFDLKDSIKLHELKEKIEQGKLHEVLQSVESVMKQYKRVQVSEDSAKLLYNGNQLPIKFVTNNQKLIFGEEIFVFDCNQNVIGIYLVGDEILKPTAMLI